MAMRAEPLAVTVDLWHPECWTLSATAGRDGAILGHGTAARDGVRTGRYTVCGESLDAVSALADAVRAAPAVERADPAPPAPAAGPASRGLLVAYDDGPSVRGAFAARGFVHSGPSRHDDGSERRDLVVYAPRPAVDRALDDLAAAYDADLSVTRVAPVSDGATPTGDDLSPRQREAFDLARERGYYARPRQASATDLAAELGVTPATYREHLRKAEAKILNPRDDRRGD
jgi:predicted DNA binding protein